MPLSRLFFLLDCASLWLHDVVADGFAELAAIERHLCFKRSTKTVCRNAGGTGCA